MLERPAFPMALLCGSFLGRRLAGILAAFQISAVCALAYVAAHRLVPDLHLVVLGGGAGPPVPATYIYSHAAMVSFVIVITGQLGRTLERVFRTTLRRSIAAQQESLDVYNDRVRELTALSAEIAHELKNPLASVKGLAALLAQNVQEGKSTERLGVLRGEVDRMQSVLEEFLTFSRPLLPLALVPCDLADIAKEVVALHEGLAQPCGLRITTSGSSVPVRCDPRKLKQVLINLVQNAIEASPAGSTVEIETRRVEQSALVRVSDRGHGVTPALGDLFEPGVTSKPSGSGIGLTIARALARQHGGELDLGPREGGGSVAEVRLPVGGEVQSGAQAQ
ncbi:MAG: HAMP domain-containing histidine kinase [Polyangiaceae bacterium]|nr:HAMP domain-containing histidine kinase [Polyangiaceae bacterium]